MAAVEKDLYLKIGRPTNSCVACGAEIAHAGKHPSILRKAAENAEALDGSKDADDLGPRREDYCSKCWQDLSERDFVGYWLAKREPPKVRKIESKKERNAGLLAWFEHLQSQERDEETRQSLFFLAHLLMKYGVFKWQRTETAEDDSELIFFKATGSEDEVSVATVELSDERSVEIKRELDAFLLQYANLQTEPDPGKDEVPAAAEPESETDS